MDIVAQLYLERFGVHPSVGAHQIQFEGVFHTTATRGTGNCEDLVITCSDWTLEKPQREFIEDCCGVTSASTIAIPGGPLALVCGFPDLVANAPSDGRSRRQVVNAFLSMPRSMHRARGSRRIWAITHSGCKFCTDMFHELDGNPDAMRTFQGMLMAELFRAMQSAIPGADVKMFIAEGSAGERPCFSEIVLTPAVAVL